MKNKWTFYIQRSAIDTKQVVDLIKVEVKGAKDFFTAVAALHEKAASQREKYDLDVIQAVQVEDIEEIVFTIEVE